MRIAISIWDDKISPVLDTASKLLIIDKGNLYAGSKHIPEN